MAADLSFDVTVEHLPRISLITLAGRIDSTAQERLAESYAAVATEATDTLVLDFANVRYINSSGIALIINLIARARAASRETIVASLSDHYRYMFEITRLNEYVQIVHDRGSALEHLARRHDPNGDQLSSPELPANQTRKD